VGLRVPALPAGQRRPPEKRGGRYKGKGAGHFAPFLRQGRQDDGGTKRCSMDGGHIARYVCRARIYRAPQRQKAKSQSGDWRSRKDKTAALGQCEEHARASARGKRREQAPALHRRRPFERGGWRARSQASLPGIRCGGLCPYGRIRAAGRERHNCGARMVHIEERFLDESPRLD
jgi:hypothetical protein